MYGEESSMSEDEEVEQPTIHNIEGRIVDGFEILEKFAGGAFSSVHFARHILTDNFCAVKIVDLGSQSQKTFQDIMREISVFMQVQHSNICSLFRLSVLNKMLFFFMEYAPKGTLLQYVNKNGRLTEQEANRIFIQLHNSLLYVHAFHFLVHRDLKLENVLLDANNNVKLIDFGLAGTFYCNILKSFVGTPGYTPPEIVAGNEYGEECDIWSLGVCLYCMLTGALPFTAQSHDYLALVEEAEKLQLPGRTGMSPQAADLIKRMLQPRPDRRITLAQMQTHPWMRGSVPMPNNLAPKPIVFYRVHGYADILKFKRNSVTNPDAKLVSECAEANHCEESEVVSALKNGAINELTTTYFIMMHPLKEKPVAPAQNKLPPLQKVNKRSRTAGKLVEDPVVVPHKVHPQSPQARIRHQTSVGPKQAYRKSRYDK